MSPVHTMSRHLHDIGCIANKFIFCGQFLIPVGPRVDCHYPRKMYCLLAISALRVSLSVHESRHFWLWRIGGGCGGRPHYRPISRRAYAACATRELLRWATLYLDKDIAHTYLRGPRERAVPGGTCTGRRARPYLSAPERVGKLLGT